MIKEDPDGGRDSNERTFHRKRRVLEMRLEIKAGARLLSQKPCRPTEGF